MLEIEKLKKVSAMSRRMFLINNICSELGVDIYYLFGLLNMYNVKNRGRWFWQKATFTGVLKDDFDKFNSFMDRFSGQFKAYDQQKVDAALEQSQNLLQKLIIDLETSMFIDRQVDSSSVKMYVDDNIKSLISQSLKGL
ncbi:MAG: hypothetical protein FJW66_05290 [Actinobacteria bacterium]|nr:hypothetical protein [Actinomycetota bacterium]